MVFFSSIHHVTKNDKEYKVNPVVPIFGISMVFLLKVLDIAIGFTALYFYFKCNWAKGSKKNISAKILQLLAALCCSPCYIAYHVAIPC